MKIQFKEQKFQLNAVASIVDIFSGQPNRDKDDLRYLMDPGRHASRHTSRGKVEGSKGATGQEVEADLMFEGFRNAHVLIDEEKILKRIRTFQTQYGIKPSEKLSKDGDNYNLTIEMETGTGKTYTYIRTIMELNKQYGWLKFIIVVPSVAIREGVLKSFQMMDDHFQMEYGKKPRYFVYDSSKLTEIDNFANSSDIRVMIINSQAFNATGKDARRIHMEQETFRWRRPIDVIAAMNPILIIDEPQSVEGKKTKERLADFKPLMTLRYSATHKKGETHDMVYRLDAMDAYKQKLVKQISVKAIEKIGTTGTDGYLYLQSLEPTKTGPKARIEFNHRTQSGIKKTTKVVTEPFDLYAESGELEAYKGWTLREFDARVGVNSISYSAIGKLEVGEVIGELNDDDLRRIQIRETIKSHLEKEARLFKRGIKVLSLFFIDEVAKYRVYGDDGVAGNGVYAGIFEEEYVNILNDYVNGHTGEYVDYLLGINAGKTHQGYFSIDKSKKGNGRFIDSKLERGTDFSNDVDAYDLIMKDKERLLSFDEPVRFLFSHSALKEGWDNPNVFQICTLKHSSAETRKRQEIGRGMRLAVNQQGIRQDLELLGDEVHLVNKLTVIANESYDSFSRGLQSEMRELLANRPVKVNKNLFEGKVIENEDGQTVTISDDFADKIMFSVIQAGFVDADGQLTETFFTDSEAIAVKLAPELAGFEGGIIDVINSVYDERHYKIENESDSVIEVAKHFDESKFHEFKELWHRINKKSTYTVAFDDEELTEKAVEKINNKLAISEVIYQTTQARAEDLTVDGYQLKSGKDDITQNRLATPEINVRYDLLGEIAQNTDLTRLTVASILSRIEPHKFDLFKRNPEAFILKVGKLINEEKATQIIKHIEYNILDERFETDIFTENPEKGRYGDALMQQSLKGVYNYVKLDSKTEAEFKENLDAQEAVKVYVKLPKKFKISTPVGNYSPDWAITFKEEHVKHIYFVAETKGSLSSMDLKGTESAKIECARRHFRKLQEQGILENGTVYEVVDDYDALMAIVRG